MSDAPQIITNLSFSHVTPAFLSCSTGSDHIYRLSLRESDHCNMPSADQKPRTLYDKVFQDHIVDEPDDGTILLYIGIKSSPNDHLLFAHILHR